MTNADIETEKSDLFYIPKSNTKSLSPLRDNNVENWDQWSNQEAVSFL